MTLGQDTPQVGTSPEDYAVGRFQTSVFAQMDSMAANLPVTDLNMCRAILESGEPDDERTMLSNRISQLVQWSQDWQETRHGPGEEAEGGG